MTAAIRYCTTEDGVRLAYCLEGKGPPVLIRPVFLESFSLHHLAHEVEDFYHTVGQGRTLIFYDYRGTGLSDRKLNDVSLEAILLDIEAVAAAAELQRFAIWSPAMSGPSSVLYAAANPDRVSALILYSTFARASDAFTPETIQAFEAMMLTNWEVFCQTIADLGAARTEARDAPVRYATMDAQSTTGEMAARFTRQNADVDATCALRSVKARTLVIHRTSDSVRPIALSQTLAAGIPGARLVTPPGAVSGYMWGDVKSITDAVNSFLDEHTETRRIAGDAVHEQVAATFRTVLFTDIVGHTEMMQRLGDAKGRDVLREHERITRETLKQHGGAEVKTMGDGFMASFGSVTQAMECAIALQRAFAGALTPPSGHPSPTRGEGELDAREVVAIRIGLNAGEPIEEDGDLFGSTVILASRIAAKAGAGEILVPDTVRGLLSGKGFMFGDRGEFVPKGFDEGVRLWDVRWWPDGSPAGDEGA